PKDTPTVPEGDVRISPTRRWREQLKQICSEIEQAVSRGHLRPFDRGALPFSPKALYAVLAQRYRAAGHGELPVKLEPVRKELNRVHGWKAKRGYQDAAATRQLKELFKL